MSESGTMTVVNDLTGGWRHLLVLGVIDVLIGIIALAWPGATVLAMALIFGVFLLICGVTALAIGVRSRSVLTILFGALVVIGAIVCLAHPGAGIVAILLSCAVWFLLLGAVYLAAAFGAGQHRIWWFALGVLSIAAAVVMVASPGVAIATVALLVGISFVVRGAAELILGLRLRALRNRVLS